jgi:hypothetical protein
MLASGTTKIGTGFRCVHFPQLVCNKYRLPPPPLSPPVSTSTLPTKAPGEHYAADFAGNRPRHTHPPPASPPASCASQLPRSPPAASRTSFAAVRYGAGTAQECVSRGGVRVGKHKPWQTASLGCGRHTSVTPKGLLWQKPADCRVSCQASITTPLRYTNVQYGSTSKVRSPWWRRGTGRSPPSQR